MSLQWKLKRLKAMGLKEVIYRTKQRAQTELESLGIGIATPSSPIGRANPYWATDLSSGMNDIDPTPYISAADNILSGHFNVFSLKNKNIGFPPLWNKDPKTGTEAPLKFGKKIDYRNERIVGDIKYLWEPNRHAELVTIAQAWFFTGDLKYFEACKTLLTSWFSQCKYPYGPNWTSSLEHAVRLANWAVAWHLIEAGEERHNSNIKREDSLISGEFLVLWLDCIYRHLHFIAGHLSLFSSANNHLLGEYMGLFIGSTAWPLWPECSRWQAQGKNGFEAEALKQNFPDGVNQEQGIWYHHEVIDMMLLCGVFGKAHDMNFSPDYWNRLEAMLEFVASIMDCRGNVPMFGDSDDAIMVRWTPRMGPAAHEKILPDSTPATETGFVDIYKSLLATGATLFDRPDFANKASVFDQKSQWLLGQKGKDAFLHLLAGTRRSTKDKTESTEQNFPRDFPDGGYYIFGENFGEQNEILGVIDAGPLGYLSLAAHGHADALSFTLSVGGHEFLIDPGTYAYHTQKVWRDYFRGTSAHNTVRIDREDQSVIGGNFLWSRHAHAWREYWASTPMQDEFCGAHDGYNRFRDPVLHRRRIRFDKKERTIVVTDSICCAKEHEVELFWNFSELCQVDIREKTIYAKQGNKEITMSLVSHEWPPRLVTGQENPPLGWASRSFDTKVPAPTAFWSGKISRTCDFVTLIKVL